ncbi:MAG: NADH:ubiquinone reductase (Na(+)-transporting) subunit B [Desulfobacterales bacterium]|jgi:Na+-transporting NADH:ubiquinone oxidoreductase subunit B
MKRFERFFDATRRHFEKGGKLEKLYPFYESIETVFFAPARVSRVAPNMRDSLDVKRYMMLVIVALLPHYAFGVYNVGYQSHLASGLGTEFWPVVWTGLKTVVPIVVVVYVFGFAWETLFASVRKHEMSEGVLVTCALLPLTLPPTIPLWQAALGISFGIVIGKEIFGGTGRNFLNPALTGRAFLYFAYPAQNSGDAIWTVLSGGRTAAVDAFSGATPLSIAAVVEPTGSIQSAFSEAGYSTTKLFFGLYPGSIGGTATFLSIAGAAFLIILGIANYRIIFGCLLGLLSTSLLLNLLAGEGSMPFLSLSPLQHLIIGGSMFAFAYMATDPVSAAHMQGARWVFGFGIGALTVLIRAYNPAFPEGVGLAVLFMNLFAPLLDHIEIKLRLKKRVPNV